MGGWVVRLKGVFRSHGLHIGPNGVSDQRFLDISRKFMKAVGMKAAKFATQLDETTLAELRAYAKSTGRSISSVVNEAVGEYLGRSQLRPAFRAAMDEILDDHADLLSRLAK